MGLEVHIYSRTTGKPIAGAHPTICAACMKPGAVHPQHLTELMQSTGPDREVFDDGPGPYSSNVVQILRHAHDRATFFLVGGLISDRPRVPAEEASLAALGDHTWTHPLLTELTTAEIRHELAAAKAAIWPRMFPSSSFAPRTAPTMGTCLRSRARWAWSPFSGASTRETPKAHPGT